MDTDLKKTTPLVSVVMPVYNASSFIEESISSILQQTFSDFEFIIINDGSTDNSRNIISSYTDSRIRIIDNEQNLGVIRSLNKGIELARGKYIARMDADDIALSNRFEKQVAFLESNPDYGLVGGYMQLHPSGTVVRVPTSDEELKATMLFHNPFVHPAVMIRKSILIRHQLTYDESLFAAEDEGLWFRIAQYCKIANLPEVLVKYRVHDQQVSTVRKTQQQNTSRQIKVRKIKHFMPIDSSLDLEFYQHWIVPDEIVVFDKPVQQKLKQWLTAIILYNKQHQKVNHRLLRIQLANLIINYASRLNKPLTMRQWIYLAYLFFLIRRFPFHFLLSLFLDIFKRK